MTQHDVDTRTRRNRGVSIILIVCLGLLVVPAVTAGAGSGPGTVNEQQPSPPSTATHATNQSTNTLVITTRNGTGRYLLSATGRTSTQKKEAGDVYQPPVMQGSVGQQGDQKDVVTYTGRITSFKHRGALQVTLNGRSVSPDVLNGDYITISTSNETQTRYRISANRTISRGGDADRADRIPSNRSRVTGTISGNDSRDSFYYTGGFDGASATHNVSIAVNGQPLSFSKTATASSPQSDRSNAPSATASPAPDGATGTDTGDHASATRPASSGDGSRPPDRARGTAQSETGDGLSLLELLGGVGGMLVVAVIGLLALSR